MSGHSHFSTIKHKKAIEDEKRGKVFSKLARMISVVAKQGADPEINPKLRRALDEARKLNMPKENIERAIKKGTGELTEECFEEVIYEVFGPGNIAFIIEGITDNKNRTLGEIKQILNYNQVKLANEGSVKWMFEKKGIIVINLKPNEDLELIAIEAGAEDIYWHQEQEVLDIYTKLEEMEKVKKNLENKGIKIESASLDWVAKEFVEASEKEKKIAEKLYEQLDENEAVQEIYSNLKA